MLGLYSAGGLIEEYYPCTFHKKSFRIQTKLNPKEEKQSRCHSDETFTKNGAKEEDEACEILSNRRKSQQMA